MTDSLLSYTLRNRGRGTPADLSKSRKGSTTSQGGFAYAETRKPSAEDESEVIHNLGTETCSVGVMPTIREEGVDLHVKDEQTRPARRTSCSL